MCVTLSCYLHIPLSVYLSEIHNKICQKISTGTDRLLHHFPSPFIFLFFSISSEVCVYVVYNTTIFSYSFSPLILTTHELTRQEGARREYKRGGGGMSKR